MINNIIKLLREILREIEEDNPFELIGKGGTILSVYYLNHRDSQDLDFDCHIKHREQDFNAYFNSIFERIGKKYNIKYRINKMGTFSNEGRFHMKVIFSTYKELPQTKMEINLIEQIPNDLVNQGKFKFYSLEQLFYQKLRVSSERAEIKDLLDVGFALKSNEPKLDYKKLKKYANIKNLIDIAISQINELENNPKEWREEFNHTELRFNVKYFPNFLKKTKTELHKLKQLI